MTKIVRLHAFGGPENLRIDDLASPQPGPGEVRLRVEAAGINRDHFTFMSGHQFSGHGFVQPKLPSRLGYEAAGIVIAIGDGVDPTWMGKHVAPFFGFDESLYGMLGEEANLPVDFLFEYPSNLTATQAAAFWVPYLTSYGALVSIANIGQGDFVAIAAASSAVGLAAIQIAKDAGAIPIAITRTRDKRDDLISLGADHVIVLAEEDFVSRTIEITQGKGLRIAFDPVGGSFLEQLAIASSPSGIIIEYGRLSDQPTPFPLMPVVGKGLSIRGYTVSEVVKNPMTSEAAKNYIIERLADGRFVPKIATTFTIDKIVEAYQYLKTNKQIGRVVITLI